MHRLICSPWAKTGPGQGSPVCTKPAGKSFKACVVLMMVWGGANVISATSPRQ